MNRTELRMLNEPMNACMKEQANVIILFWSGGMNAFLCSVCMQVNAGDISLFGNGS